MMEAIKAFLHVLDSHASDYFERCKEAVTEMYRQVGTLKFDEDEIAFRGLVVRHLVLPEN